MSDYQKPLAKTAFNEYKLRLTGPFQEGGKFPSQLQISVIKNNPRIDVFTNIPNDRDYGKISAPMDTLTLFALLEELDRIIAGPADQQVKIVNKTGWKENVKVISNTVFGKDKEGRVWISVLANDRAKIKFVFLPSEWHQYVHRDGTPYSEAELSIIYAKAWVNAVRQLVPNVLDTHYSEPEPRGNGGGNKGGNKGGYNKGGYNKGGQSNNRSNDGFDNSSNSSSDDFDDFPM